MKYHLVFVSLTSLILTEVVSFGPKYIPNAAVITKLRSLDDTRFTQSRQLQSPEISVNDDRHEENYKFTDYLRNPSHKLSINLPSEDDRRKNRLPEVNLKDLINSKEVPNDESVEDFVDLSFEETDSSEQENKLQKDIINARNKYNNNQETITENSNNAAEFRSNYGHINKRTKRLATAVYDGRYKSQDINDVLKSITGSKLQTNKLDEKTKVLAKSRRKRNSNIIEEENLETTISIFKFTGRASRLNEDLVFKNIHTFKYL